MEIYIFGLGVFVVGLVVASVFFVNDEETKKYNDIDQAIGDLNEFIYYYNVNIYDINEYRNGNQLKKKGTRSSLFLHYVR